MLTRPTTTGPTRRIRRVLLPALALALSAAALVPATAEAAPAPAPAAAAPPGNPGTPCGRRLECASVTVPLDWAHRGGRTLELAVIRHLASRPDRRIGALFFNPGGPGDSGVDAVAARAEEFDALTEGRFDVLSWDPRGSGRSAPVTCFADAAERAAFWGDLVVPTTRADGRRWMRKTVQFAARCGERNGDLLAHISMADQVRDLDHLRALVGERRLTFLGESNGTLMGQTYANMFPRRVRAMALDGIVDPIAYNHGTAAALAGGLEDADLVFAKFMALCQAAGPDRCALAGHGSVARRVDRMLTRLRHTPLPAPSAGPPGELSYGEAVSVIKFALLADPARWPLGAQMLEQMAEGDGSAAKDFATVLTSDGFRIGFEQNVALTCADAPARQTAAEWPRVVRRLTAVSRVGGPPFGWLTGAPCSAWPARSAVRFTGPWNAVTRTPILLTNMRYEPNTPLAAARAVERRLGNAVLLVHDGYGHLNHVDPSACVDAALTDYLVRLETPARGTVCPSDHVPFAPDFPAPQG